MKKIIAFAGSNSKTSINKQLVTYAAVLCKSAEVEVLDLNHFELPLFSVDVEKEREAPKNVFAFLEYLKLADGFIVSMAEHNGAYSAVFKNILDWVSRTEPKLFFGKPMLLMATSPGGRGGKSVLEIARNRFPRHDANIVAIFSLPSFNDNFKNGKIVDKSLNTELFEAINKFENEI
ncbi:MAG: NADPH-dependent FMN reductase [Aestuariibaculum sp.]